MKVQINGEEFSKEELEMLKFHNDCMSGYYKDSSEINSKEIMKQNISNKLEKIIGCLK